MTEIDVSIVIGFRDWGIARLRRAVSSIQGAAAGLAVEVIISDYGSRDPSLAEALAAELDVRLVFTPGDQVWSRSRALNAGFAQARGSLLIATDADMLFAPGSLRAIHDEAHANAPCAMFLQSRDLPEDLPAIMFDDLDSLPWDELDRRSVLRPRWGMGGMVAVDRRCMAALNGFDERLHTYGREDLDFALRARRAGYRTAWTQDPRARMYHMWHPQTLEDVSVTPEGKQAIARNRTMVDRDATVARNATRRSAVPSIDEPLVSIVVVPSPDGLPSFETVATALSQSVQAIEVVVVGSNADGASSTLDDPRLRSLPLEDCEDADRSLSTAVAACAAPYISVVRAGDLLPLDRTELLLSGIREGDSVSTGRTVAAGADGTLGSPDEQESLYASLLRVSAAQAVLSSSLSSDDASAFARGVRRVGLALADVAHVVTVSRSATTHPGPASALADLEQLRPLLPPALGGEGRDAHLQRLHPGLTLPPLDGTAHYRHIRHGGKDIRGGVEVRGASYDDLVVLARTGSGLRISAPVADDAQAAASWLEPIVQHCVEHGSSFPLRVSLIKQPASMQQDYTVEGASGSFGVVVAPTGDTAAPTGDTQGAGGGTWMLIGTAIEEIWQ